MDNDQLIMDNEKIYSEFISGQSKIETLYVLGMAKSFLDLEGAKKEKLELDFLKILYAFKTRKENEQVIGYMSVVKSEANLENRLESWKSKYSTTPVPIEIIPFDKKEEIEKLKREKKKNKTGIIKNSKELSEAKEGKQILEEFLREHIESKLKDIKETKEDKLFGVNWDYYAKLERKN